MKTQFEKGDIIVKKHALFIKDVLAVNEGLKSKIKESISKSEKGLRGISSQYRNGQESAFQETLTFLDNAVKRIK